MPIILDGGFSPPLCKMMDWKSVGIMEFLNIWKVIRFMFQTTNQLSNFVISYLYILAMKNTAYVQILHEKYWLS